MIVCHCRVVSDRDIEVALSAGARTVGAACRATGAAHDCGSCVFSVKNVVERHRVSQDAQLRVDGAAS